MCQSLIKKDELGTDSAVLGTGQMPVASPSCTVPMCMALLNTVTEDRVQAREGLLRFLVQTLLALLRLILPSFFFNTFLSHFLFLILFFILFLSLLHSSAFFNSHLPLLVFVTSPSFQQHDSLLVLGSSIVLLFSLSFIFEFQKDDTYVDISCSCSIRSSHVRASLM